MPPAITSLTERRVPQYLAVYLGASWGLVQFVDFIATHYGFSPTWTTLALLSVALLLPSVLLYTYHHGRPGRDEWQRSEKIFIPMNLLLLMAVLFVVGANSNLSALTTHVKVKDEKGNVVEKDIVNSAYRKRVALFSLDVANGTPKWMTVAVPLLTTLHLQQQQFVQTVSSLDMRARLQESGYADGSAVPIALKRQLADERHIPYFLAGTLSQSANGVTAQVQLYETATAKLLQQHTFGAPSITQIADMTSEQLMKDLRIPQLGDAKPLVSTADIVSTKNEAVRAIMEAVDALVWHNDYKAARAHLDVAVKVDPTAAYAHLLQYSVAMQSGAQAAMLSSIQAAMNTMYRLPERMQSYVKADYYIAKQDYPRAFAVTDMMSQLYPEDIEILDQKAMILQTRDDKPALVATLKKILRLDPTRGDVLLQLGRVYERQGDAKSAVAQYEAYARKYPTDIKSFRTLADMYNRIGEHQKATDAYEQALLLKPADVVTLVAYASLERKNGDFESAESKLQDALNSAKTPEDRVRALQGLLNLQQFRGEIGKSLATAQQGLVEAARFQPPIENIWTRFIIASMEAKLDPAKALKRVDAMKQNLGLIFAQMAPIAYLAIYDEMGDAAKEEAMASALDASIQKTSFNSLLPLSVRGHGRALELRGDCAGAIQVYQKVAAMDLLNPEIQRDIGRCYRKLNQSAQALEALNAMLKVAPADGEANLEMALLYKQNGDIPRSKQYAAVAMKTWQNADPAYRPAQQAGALR